jgi:hypothetical protein
MPSKAGANEWSLVSSRGAVLFYVAVHPGCAVNQIADEMSLTRRTVWGLVGDLRRQGILRVTRAGREHRYSVNPDAAFPLPVVRGVTVRMVLAGLEPLFPSITTNHR